MGFLDNFIDKTPKDPIAKIKKTQPVATIGAEIQPAPIAFTSIMSGGGYTGKFDSVFDSIIEKENLPGPDVAELITSVRELQNAGFPEEQAFRSAFTALKSMGLTKEKLIETSDYYLGIATTVHDDFKVNVVGKKEQEFNTIAQKQQDLMGQMEKLTLELQELNSKKTTIGEEISNYKQEVEGSYNKALTFFNNVKFKIQNYL